MIRRLTSVKPHCSITVSTRSRDFLQPRPFSRARNFKYSRTRISGYSGLFSGMKPIRRRTSSDWWKTSKPATRAVPLVAGMKHERIRIVVLLPAPFGPSSPTISPRATENEMSLTAVRPA